MLKKISFMKLGSSHKVVDGGITELKSVERKSPVLFPVGHKMWLCMKPVLLGIVGLFLLNYFFNFQYRTVLFWFITKRLYDTSEVFMNERSPFTTFRLAQTARLSKLQLRIDLQLEARFLNPNHTATEPVPPLGEWERQDLERVVTKVHLSMLKEGLSPYPYYKQVPWEDALRLKKSLEKEAILAYRVETFSSPACTNRKNNDFGHESRIVPLPTNPGTPTNLYQRNIAISDIDFPYCEQVRRSFVHIPRGLEPKRGQLSWTEWIQETLVKVRGKEARAKCFSTTRTIKKFKRRAVPDTMVSVLFCY